MSRCAWAGVSCMGVCGVGRPLRDKEKRPGVRHAVLVLRLRPHRRPGDVLNVGAEYAIVALYARGRLLCGALERWLMARARQWADARTVRCATPSARVHIRSRTWSAPRRSRASCCSSQGHTPRHADPDDIRVSRTPGKLLAARCVATGATLAAPDYSVQGEMKAGS